MVKYTEKNKKEIFEKVFERISNGEALRNILKDEGFPRPTTFYHWLDKDEKGQEQYTRACAYRADYLFEEILTIADTPEEGVTVKTSKQGKETTKADMLGHRRLKIDARKWLLGKMNPTKYGDNQKEEPDDKPPIQLVNGKELPD